MNRRSLLGGMATLALIASACSSSATPSPSSAPPTSAPPASVPATTGSAASPSASAAPSLNLPTSIGKGEGALNIIIWAGYAEDGTNQKAYDWVHPFETATGCKVTVKEGNTSDEMVTLMRQGGGTVYDGVSASGDATNRLIANGDVAPINVDLIPDYKNIAPFLQSPPHNTVNGVHYGISHGWGGNSLMYRTDLFNPAPTSWSAVFDPTLAAAYSGKITDYDSPIYIADAALYLMAHKPDLGITDPYELTQPEFDAAVQLLKDQHPFVGKYWGAFGDEIDNFTSGASTIGTTWPYQVNTLKGQTPPVKIESVVPSEGMTGWADTWMMSSHAQHPNCMYMWMAWMVTPMVQAEVAESFGEAPANPQACAILDTGTLGPYGLKNFCTLYHVNDQSYYSAIKFWKTPLANCGDSRGTTCVDYSAWTTAWTEIKG
jgi:putative spermidine/putrescine transport system substrate-binding protein